MPNPADLRAKSKKRLQEEGGLTITSLMDMMTIILVFLLKSYSVEDIQVKPSEDLRLPLSSSKKDPEVAVNVVVSKRTLSVVAVSVIDVVDSEVAEEYKGKAKIVKVNVDEERDIAGQMGIRSIPTIALFHKGEVKSSLVGARPKQDFTNLIDSVLPS